MSQMLFVVSQHFWPPFVRFDDFSPHRHRSGTVVRPNRTLPNWLTCRRLLLGVHRLTNA